MSENDYLAAKLVQLFWAWDLPLVCWWLEDLCKHSFAWDSNCIARSRELYIHFCQGQFAKMTLCQERSLYCSEAYRAADFPSRWLQMATWLNHGSWVVLQPRFCGGFICRVMAVVLQKFSGVLELHKRLLWKSVWLSCEWPRKVTMQKHGEVDKSLLGDMAWIGFMPF